VRERFAGLAYAGSEKTISRCCRSLNLSARRSRIWGTVAEGPDGLADQRNFQTLEAAQKSHLGGPCQCRPRIAKSMTRTSAFSRARCDDGGARRSLQRKRPGVAPDRGSDLDFETALRPESAFGRTGRSPGEKPGCPLQTQAVSQLARMMKSQSGRRPLTASAGNQHPLRALTEA